MLSFGIAGELGSTVPFVVSNGNDDGAGSLRAALKAAAEPGAPGHIFVTTDDDIIVTTTLTYDGTAPLAIYGSGQSVTTEVNTTLLSMSNGADLSVSGLNFRGPGEFSVVNRGDETGEPGKGIFVKLRDDQTGTLSLTLEDVSLSGAAYHGIHVSDCDLGDACGAGATGEGNGSPASVSVHLSNVTIWDVGNGKFDADGIRVDERGDGDIRFVSRNSTFEGVGADGVELDEGQAGDVIATVISNTFADNGGYCAPDVLEPFLPEDDEGEFEDGEVSPSDIPGAITGTPDDACFERDVELYDSGFVKEYEIEIDLDDGIDIDEAGSGDLRVLMIASTIRGNLDEGFDVGEQDAGGLDVWAWRTTAQNNTDDGFRGDEEGPGSVSVLLYDVQSEENGGYGARFSQEDQGDISVVADNTTTSGNGDGDKMGLRVQQAGSGTGTLTTHNATFSDGIDARNVELIQQ
ncbi:MAG: hypothetical protein AAF563_05710 [Pseudomonadota bacterium]